jgi:hypothetical protein
MLEVTDFLYALLTQMHRYIGWRAIFSRVDGFVIKLSR